jgi:hypothetical protein
MSQVRAESDRQTFDIAIDDASGRLIEAAKLMFNDETKSF